MIFMSNDSDINQVCTLEMHAGKSNNKFNKNKNGIKKQVSDFPKN